MFSLAHVLAMLSDPLGRRAGDEARRARAACARFVRRTRAAERAFRAIANVSLAWACVAGCAAVLLGMDLVLAPSGRARALAAASLLVAGGMLGVVALLAGALGRFSDRWLARRIEERFPVLDGRLLVVASDRSRSPAVDGFVPGLARDLGRSSSLSVPSRAGLHRAGFLALAATSVLAGALLVYSRLEPARLGRAVLLLDEPPPQTAARLLSVRPGAVRLVEGQGVSIEAGCAGEPARAQLLVMPRDRETRADARSLPLEKLAHGRLGVTLPALLEDVCYQVAIDGDRSEVFPIDVIHAPRIVSVSHREDPPAYLHLEAREVAGGDVDAIEGTRITVRAQTSSAPLAGKLRAVWTGEGLIETIPLEVAGPRALEASFVAKHGGSYRIEYSDATGLAPRESAAFAIAVRPDLPPRAEILAPAADREIPHAGALAVEYEVRDDHGLGSLALHVAVKGGRAKKIPLPFQRGARVARGKLALAPRELGLFPGDSLLYYVVAEDEKTPLPNRGASQPYVLVVEEDSATRGILTGIDPREEEGFRALEGAPFDGAPETEEELARDVEALRRLEALVAGRPDASEAPDEVPDPLEELTPEEKQALARALEDLDLDEEQFLDPPADQADAPSPDGAQGDKNARGARANRMKGAKGRSRDDARDSAKGRSFLQRVSRKDIVRRYREMLERRRELLRKLAAELALGKPLPDSLLQKLGPGGARLLEALKGSGGPDPGASAVPHTTEAAAGRFASGLRTLRMRDEIPRDAVELAPSSAESAVTETPPRPSRAAAWDEQLPPEMRAVVRQYFKSR